MRTTIIINFKVVAKILREKWSRKLLFILPLLGLLIFFGYLGCESLLIRLLVIPKLTIVGKDQVTCICFSPNSRLLASGTGYRWPPRPGAIQLWNAATGQLEHTLLSQGDCAVRSITFSSDGRILASGSESDTGYFIDLWDLQTNKILHTLPHPGWLSNNISIAFSPDGKILASATGDVKLWDVSTGELLQTLPIQIKRGTPLSFSPDGKIIACIRPQMATIGENHGRLKTIPSRNVQPEQLLGGLQFWDIKKKQILRVLPDEASWGIAFSPNGKSVVSVSTVWGDAKYGIAKTGVTVFDVATNAIKWEHDYRSPHGHTHWGLDSVAFSPDGKIIATELIDYNAQSSVYLLNAVTGDLMKELRVPLDKKDNIYTGSSSPVAFSPNSQTIATRGKYQIRLWAINQLN